MQIIASKRNITKHIKNQSDTPKAKYQHKYTW